MKYYHLRAKYRENVKYEHFLNYFSPDSLRYIVLFQKHSGLRLHVGMDVDIRSYIQKEFDIVLKILGKYSKYIANFLITFVHIRSNLFEFRN